MCIRSTSFQTPEKYSLLRNVSCNYRIEIPIINLHLWFGLFFEKINKKSIFVLQWKCDYLTKCTKLYRILTWFRTFNAGFLTHFAIKKYNCILPIKALSWDARSFRIGHFFWESRFCGLLKYYSNTYRVLFCFQEVWSCIIARDLHS